MHLLVGTAVAIVFVGLGIMGMRIPDKKTGDPHLDGYRAKFLLKGWIMVVAGFGVFVVGVLMQVGAVGPK